MQTDNQVHTDQYRIGKGASPITLFWDAPLSALFKQPVIAQVLVKSESWCERARWEGNGPKFLRIGRSIVYKKADVVDWLDKHQSVTSTSQYPIAVRAR